MNSELESPEKPLESTAAELTSDSRNIQGLHTTLKDNDTDVAPIGQIASESALPQIRAKCHTEMNKDDEKEMWMAASKEDSDIFLEAAEIPGNDTCIDCQVPNPG
jgi:hypothetical protein